MEDKELRKEIELAVKASLRKCKQLARRIGYKRTKENKPIKEFEYYRKINALISSLMYVQWAHDLLSDENLSSAARNSVMTCLKELCDKLNEALAESVSQ